MALAVEGPFETTPKVTLAINGEERKCEALQRQPIQQGSPLIYVLNYGDRTHPTFASTFGFVTVTLGIHFADNKEFELSTREIPCTCSCMPKRTIIANMLSELSGIDNQPALAWMLGGERNGAQASALRGGGSTKDHSRSIRAFMSLAERSLMVLEKNLPLFRARPLSRTLSEEKMVPANQVRRVGRAETVWLSLNPKFLAEVTAEQGIKIVGKHYAPTSLRTSLPKRSLDNVENRSVLGFVAHIVDALDDTLKKLAAALERMKNTKAILSNLEGADDLLPSLVVANVCIELEEPLIDRIRTLGKQARKMLRLYRDTLGNFPEGKYLMPRRSKAFREIPHYATLWSAMKEWEFFGTYPLSRETLLLSTYKMDRLYEYYVLYHLLRWFQDAGFSPDPALGEDALESVFYSLEDIRFRNETQVVNKYALRRGSERLTIYYQPVVYGDMRAEGGIDLHRTTAKKWLGTHRKDSYWTPDYVIYIERGEKKFRYVLDAKFSTIGSVDTGYAIGQRDSKGLTEFQKCLAKYRYAILSEDGMQIDGMWLICGRESYPKTTKVCASSWLEGKSLPALNDGVSTLAPGVNALDDLFMYLGIRGKATGGSGIEDRTAIAARAVLGKADASIVSMPGQSKTSGKSVWQNEPVETSDSGLPIAVLSLPESKHAPCTEECEAMAQTRPTPNVKTIGTRKASEKSLSNAKVIDPEVFEDILAVWHSLPEEIRKNCAQYSQRELGIGRPFVRVHRPVGKEATYYTEAPIDIDGISCYVFCDWKPVYRIKLAKAAKLACKHASK